MTEETMGDVVAELGRAIHALNPALMPVVMDTSEIAKLHSDYERVTLLFSKLRHLSRPAPSEASGDVVERHHCETCGFSGRLPNNLSHHKNPKTGAYCFGLITRSTTPAPQADAKEWRDLAERSLLMLAGLNAFMLAKHGTSATNRTQLIADLEAKLGVQASAHLTESQTDAD